MKQLESRTGVLNLNPRLFALVFLLVIRPLALSFMTPQWRAGLLASLELDVVMRRQGQGVWLHAGNLFWF